MFWRVAGEKGLFSTVTKSHGGRRRASTETGRPVSWLLQALVKVSVGGSDGSSSSWLSSTNRAPSRGGSTGRWVSWLLQADSSNSPNGSDGSSSSWLSSTNRAFSRGGSTGRWVSRLWPTFSTLIWPGRHAGRVLRLSLLKESSRTLLLRHSRILCAAISRPSLSSSWASRTHADRMASSCVSPGGGVVVAIAAGLAMVIMVLLGLGSLRGASALATQTGESYSCKTE